MYQNILSVASFVSYATAAKTALLAAMIAPGAVSGQIGMPAQDRSAELSSLLARAEANNPEIRAARHAAEAAEAQVLSAGALPDPILGVGVMNVPVADPSLGRDMMTMTTIQVGETFPWPGKRGLREEVAEGLAAAARWEVERTRQAVLAEVKSAYYRIYFLDRALEVTARNESRLADFARLTSTQYGVGTGRQPDVLRAQVERTRLRDQLVALRQERESVAARLNALLARPSDTPVPDVEMPEEVRLAALEEPDGAPTFASVSLADGTPDGDAPSLPSVQELQRRALARNPMIQAHVSRVAAQERSVALAGKAALPDFNVSVAYSRRPDFSDFVNVMISLPIPVFRSRKQDQAVIQEMASLSRHDARHHAMVNEVNSEIASLAADLRRAREQLGLLSDGILPQARASLASSTASYRVGQVDFLTLLDSQVTLYRHQLDRHRLLSDFATDLAALEKAVGTEVLP